MKIKHSIQDKKILFCFKFLTKIALSFLLLFVSNHVMSQSWDNFISGNNITSIQNIPASPYIYVGSLGAIYVINKSDGVIQEINSANHGLPCGNIRDLDFDSDNNLWAAAYGGGIFKMNNAFEFSYYNTKNSNFPSNGPTILEWEENFTRSISCGGGDKVYFGLDEIGIGVFQNGYFLDSLYNYYNSPIAPNSGYFDCLETKNGETYIGTETGLFKLKAGVVSSVMDAGNNKINAIGVSLDTDDHIWVGTEYNLYHLQNGTVSTTFDVGTDIPERVVALTNSTPGKVWVGTSGGGIVHIDETSSPATFKYYSKTNSGLHSNYVVDMALSGNNLWIAFSSRVQKFDIINETWETFVLNQSNPLLDDFSLPVGSYKNYIYVGGHSELHRFNMDNGEWTSSNNIDIGFDIEQINLLRNDGQDLFFSTGSSLVRFDGNLYSALVTDIGTNLIPDIIDFRVTNKGAWFVISEMGAIHDPNDNVICVLNPSDAIKSIDVQTNTNYAHFGNADTVQSGFGCSSSNHFSHDSLGNVNVIAFCETNNAFYYGTDLGLASSTGPNMYNAYNSPIKTAILSMKADLNGSLWLGMDGRSAEFPGLIEFETATGVFKEYFAETSGLPCNTVYDLAISNEGRIIASTECGIGVLGPTPLPTDVVGMRDQERSVIFPNPVTDFVSFFWNDHTNFSVDIYSITGIQIKKLHFSEGSCSINLEWLKSGIYIVRFTSRKAEKFSKFVKL